MTTDYSEQVILALNWRAQGHDIEFTASAVWQALLQKSFPLQDGYTTLCEQCPDDDDRSRIDQIVFQLGHNTLLVKLCMGESKRRGTGSAHIVGAETQAFNGAGRAINRDGLAFMYAVTTWGTHFRLWRLDSDQPALQPMDGGSNTRGDRGSYLDVGKPENRALFDRFVRWVKGLDDHSQEHPQDASWHEQTPGLPSERGAQYPQPQFYGTEVHQGPSYWSGDVPAAPAEQFEGYGYEEGEPSTRTSGGNPRVEVKVTVVKHTLRPDNWLFKIRNETRRTDKSQWKKEKHNGEDVWVYHGKKTPYFTRQSL
ncbi:hypothetical protein VTK56DRAFT_1242 [Thermocarpiscus australiensis]